VFQQIRSQLNLSQEELSERLGVPSSDINKYESGDHKIEMVVLERLAYLYGDPLSKILAYTIEERDDWEAALMERAEDECTEGQDGVATLIRQVRRFHELHEVVGEEPPDTFDEPHEPLLEGNYSVEDVEMFAEEERRICDLGSAPFLSVKGTLEQIGVSVFGVPLGNPSEDLSGLYFRHSDLGPVVAVNSNQYYKRRPFTLVHELAHALFHPHRPAVMCRAQDNSLTERFADLFSAAFLVPRTALQRVLGEMGLEEARHPEDVAQLARYFGVSYLTMYYRLKVRDRIDLDAASYKDLRPVSLAKRLGYRAPVYEHKATRWPLEDRLPRRFLDLAFRAWQNGRISQSQAAALLGIGERELENRVETEAAAREHTEAYANLA